MFFAELRRALLCGMIQQIGCVREELATIMVAPCLWEHLLMGTANPACCRSVQERRASDPLDRPIDSHQ